MEIFQEILVTYSGFYSHSQQAADPTTCHSRCLSHLTLRRRLQRWQMEKHAMLAIKKAIDCINPGQIPVIVGDCPLYAQQKKCQWAYPNEVGESKMVFFMGFLHIVVASQECGGRLLAGSGWKRMFSTATVFTPGVAISLLGGKHVTRIRYAYQLTLTGLNTLKTQAYDELGHDGYGPYELTKLWELSSSHNLPLDHSARLHAYILCRFVRGQRTGDWPLTLKSIDEICPFFAFYQTNYARWTPVFLKDMVRLPHIHPRLSWKGSSLCNVMTRSSP